MPSPQQPVTLSVEQIDELNRHLSAMRHDINNQLSVILAASELMRYNPDTAERMFASIFQQSTKIGEKMAGFSAEFEKHLNLRRP